MTGYSYWNDQRCQDAYYSMHHHFPGEHDEECSLCHPQG